MSQNQKEQKKKDFLLEHYTQVNEHLRESDRSRNILLSVYSALIAGTLSFIYSTDKLEYLPKSVILGFLIAFGIGIAIYTAFARAWHCEYTRVARAIHKSFLNADLQLYQAAKEIKKEEEDKQRHYFNTRGTEFIIFLLILLFVFTELVLVFYEGMPNEDWPWLILRSMISSLLVFGVGIGLYGRYLDKKEAGFPDNSWCIINDKEEEMAESDLGKIEERLVRIEDKLDKSQKFTWSSGLYLLGVTAFGAGIGLLVYNQHALGGWLLALVGFVISVAGIVLLFRHGWFRK